MHSAIGSFVHVFVVFFVWFGCIFCFYFFELGSFGLCGIRMGLSLKTASMSCFIFGLPLAFLCRYHYSSLFQTFVSVTNSLLSNIVLDCSLLYVISMYVYILYRSAVSSLVVNSYNT